LAQNQICSFLFNISSIPTDPEETFDQYLEKIWENQERRNLFEFDQIAAAIAQGKMTKFIDDILIPSIQNIFKSFLPQLEVIC
jgi:hypothetical protein